MIVHHAAGDDPAHVRPEPTVSRRMWIAFHISVLVMDAMRRHPEKWSAFKSQCGASGQEILQPFVSLESAVSQEPVVCHADAQTAGYPPKQNCNAKSRPTEHEKSGKGSDVKSHHEKGGHPTDWFSERPVIPDAHSSRVSPESNVCSESQSYQV